MTDAQIPAAGIDPDSVQATAKHQLAAADPRHDDRAREDLDRAGAARALVAERNNASPERVAAIDKELAGLGFDLPLPVPAAAQRGDAVPVGRSAPGPDATAAKPSPAEAKPSAPAATSKPSSGKS
jgi:hypothetical protein